MKMPKAMRDKWVAALRSGEYKQDSGTLYDPDSKGYCCLGVLQMVCDGKVEEEEIDDGATMTMPMTFPTGSWFKSHDIRLDHPDTSASVASDGHTKVLVSMNDGLDRLNYGYRSDFNEIADYIEKNVEVTDE